MTQRTHRDARRTSAVTGGLLCAGVGLVFLWLGGWPVYLSYDLLFRFRNPVSLTNNVIIYMDERSIKDLGQSTTENWDRNLHAQLLNRLSDDGCSLVVLDIVFSEPGDPSANTNLAAAIQRNGKVVLAASLDYRSRPQIKVKGAVLPLPEFEAAAAAWGIAEIVQSPGQVARQYYQGSDEPSLPQAAATVLGTAHRTRADTEHVETWINYYGPPLTLPSLSYCDVTNQPAGYFRDKIVFVGARPKTSKLHDEVDEFRTPFTLWTSELSPGVEITATALLNLLRNEPLARTRWNTEWALAIGAGILAGGLCGLLRPAAAASLAGAGIFFCILAATQAAERHVWFPWTILAFVQFPVGVAWSIRNHFHELKYEKDVLERTLETSRHAAPEEPLVKPSPGKELVIPDHALIRCIGQGAYGQVWLGRNAIGLFHAIKVVRRSAFSSNEPYEREFRGIQRFMPVSRSHPGLVHVLHVGRNNELGYFFYIMEAGDDQKSGQKIDPASYVPKSLASELGSRGCIPPVQCLALGLSLSAALEHLHQQSLIHRDIKPGNIIYVQGAPKFADIGLVTDVAQTGKEVSCVGTEGYIPPEGPGTPAADIYALGKVLYEAAMGRDRRFFPEVPTAVLEQPEDTLLRRLNTVICKACASRPEDRYHSGAELHSALVALQKSGIQ